MKEEAQITRQETPKKGVQIAKQHSVKKDAQITKPETPKKGVQTIKQEAVKKEAQSTKQETFKEEPSSNATPKWIQSLEELREKGKNWFFFCGYHGAITDEGTRVYLDASLQSALEIPKDALLLIEKSDASLEGGVYVWIDQELWYKCTYLYI